MEFQEEQNKRPITSFIIKKFHDHDPKTKDEDPNYMSTSEKRERDILSTITQSKVKYLTKQFTDSKYNVVLG